MWYSLFKLSCLCKLGPSILGTNWPILAKKWLYETLWRKFLNVLTVLLENFWQIFWNKIFWHSPWNSPFFTEMPQSLMCDDLIFMSLFLMCSSAEYSCVEPHQFNDALKTTTVKKEKRIITSGKIASGWITTSKLMNTQRIVKNMILQQKEVVKSCQQCTASVGVCAKKITQSETHQLQLNGLFQSTCQTKREGVWWLSNQ